MARSSDKSEKKDSSSKESANGRKGHDAADGRDAIGAATAQRGVAAPASAHPRDPARDSALSRAVQQIEKQFGKGAVMKLDGEIQPIEGIPTGSLSLDIALGGAGVPRGRVIEVYGPELG